MKNFKLVFLLSICALSFSGCEKALEKPQQESPSTVPVVSIPIASTEELEVESDDNLDEAKSLEDELFNTNLLEVEDDELSKPEDKNITDSKDTDYPIKSFGSPYTSEGKLTNKKMAWYYIKNQENIPPSAQAEFDIREFDGYYLGDTSQKEIYLTFDQGYENGYTAKILDVLKEKNVKATFFVVETYITAHPDLVQRMVDEGHTVGNHTVKHRSCPSLSDAELIEELEMTATAFKDLTGLQMPPYFRPPMGEYSARTLKVTQDAGYKTVFWAFAYKDWIPEEQPGKALAYETYMKYLHNGSIILLHSVSSSNTEALSDMIDSSIKEGYVFKSLDDLPEN